MTDKEIIEKIKNIIISSEMYKLEEILECDECIAIAKLVGVEVEEDD